MGLASAIELLAERCHVLEKAKEAVEELIESIEEVQLDLPDGIVGSHHSEMEWSRTLNQIEEELREIEAKLNMPAKDKRYKVTAQDVERMQELHAQGMSQAAITRTLNAEGIPVSTGIVHYWVNEESRKKQRKKNAKRRVVPGTAEHSQKIERDQQKRRENWEADPDMRLRHSIQSAMDETRSERHNIQGLTKAEAEKLLKSGKLKRPNAKIPEDEDTEHVENYD